MPCSFFSRFLMMQEVIDTIRPEDRNELEKSNSYSTKHNREVTNVPISISKHKYNNEVYSRCKFNDIRAPLP